MGRPSEGGATDTRREVFASLVSLQGYSVAEAARHEGVGVSPKTGYEWMKTELVRNLIRENLDLIRLRAKQLAANRVESTLKNVFAAQTDPTVTPTMLNAMRLTLQVAGATTEDREEVQGTTLTVQVNASFGEDMAEAQRRRQEAMALSRDSRAIDADYAEVS